MKLLDRLEETFIIFLMGAATMVIFVSVVHRYTAGFAIPGLQDWLLSLDVSWAQELCIIMFVRMAKFGAAYGVRTGIHVGVDVLVNRLPQKWSKASVLTGLCGGILFTGIVGTLGAMFVWGNGLHFALYDTLGLDTSELYSGPTTSDLEWRTWVVYSAVPLGSYLMCFRFSQVAWHFARTNQLPHHDHGHVEGLEEDELVSTAQAAAKGGVK